MKIFSLNLLIAIFSISTFAQLTESQAIDSIFAEWNKSDAPGCALGIVKEGKLIYTKGYGIADLEHDLEITPSSVFYIGSVSKQFVTFCILLLEEQGKLNLDDEIQKYLPDFPVYEAPLTIRHFIHHTSGIRDYLTLMFLKGRDYLDNTEVSEVYELIKRQKELNFSPGERYLYSNSCYFMLAMIVEEVAGESIRKYAQKHIFEPLGMKQTLFYDNNRDLIKNRVFSYEPTSRNEAGFNNLISRFDLVGSGGVYSSVEDLFLWDQNFYDNKLGKGGQAIIEKMHTEGLLNNGESSGYAFALNNGTYKGLKTVSHGGALAGYRSQLMRFPEQEFSVIILANRSDANPTSKSYQVADLFLKSHFVEEPEEEEKVAESTPRPTATQQFSLNQIAGDYEIETGAVLKFTPKEDSLEVVQSWNGISYTIGNVGGNTFEIPDNKSLQFIFSKLEDNAAQELLVLQNGNETICKRTKAIDLTKVKLEDFEGNYYSEELDTRYRIYLEEGVLKLKMNNFDPLDLFQTNLEQFTCLGNILDFERKEGRVASFTVDAGRVKNLKFEKQ